MTTVDLAHVSQWMRQALAAGHLRAVWEKRLELGYGVSTAGMDQPDAFWINCAPALAALRMGQRDHPFVATCCGLAGNDLSRLDPEQAAAYAEVEHRYFSQ